MFIPVFNLLYHYYMNIDCPICKITLAIEANSKGEYHHVNPHDLMDGFLYNLVECSPLVQASRLVSKVVSVSLAKNNRAKASSLLF